MAQWTIREQLILGSAVQRSGDQNWVSVSRTIRPLSEENRQTDFYSQKNCAMHYAALLDSASTPKRKKKRGSESETGETTQDLIVRELTEKRLTEINQLLETISTEYHEVKKDLELIEKGELSEDEVKSMWSKVKDIDYNEVSISQSISQNDENIRMEQTNDYTTAFDKGQVEIVSSHSDLSLHPLNSKPITSPDTSKANAVAMPLIATPVATPLVASPIITPVGNSATLIKIEPNVAMETLGANKPVQVKVLSHDDHTYSSPGPPTLLTTSISTAATEAMENQSALQAVDEGEAAVDQDSSIVDQGSSSVDQGPSSVDQKSNTDNMATTINDQVVHCDDQSVPSANPSTNTDQPATITDQPTANTDQPISNIDQPTANADQPTTNADQPTTNADQPTSNIDQDTYDTDKAAATDQETLTNDVKPALDQVTSTDDYSNDQGASSFSHVTDQATDVKCAVDQTTPMDNQTALSANQITSVDDYATPSVDQTSPIVDQAVTNKAMPIDQDQVISDSVNKDTTPTTTVADQVTPTVDHTPPTTDQGTPNSNQVSEQTLPATEKKSRTRGSNRIAGKMKMAQVNKAKAVRATSPRTMVIIGKQQSANAVESDNEEIQVHYKEPTRRIHRLMSNEPSESEEEPLSAVTSGVTSPSSSMIDEVDPEVAQSMKLWRKSIMLVWQHASQHKFASLFLHAVKDDEAAGYSEVVFRPMDLSLLKKKIETGVIKNDMEFQRDMLLMFQNALMYNSSNHDVYMMADQMRKDVMENIQDYLATQLMVHSNARTKILRSRDSRRIEQDEEMITPLRRTRHRLPSDDSISSISGTPLAKKMRTRTNNDD